ncbi:MAG: HD domain-containing protein [Clostridiales bacterium]|jgi:putative hydrolase of HD superfamily|nr:HD domain-containing protein [Clostridiales bacterium]
MRERLRRQLEFIVEIDKMKSVYRQTLVMDKSRAETDAEHSWHFAMAAMVLREYAAEDGVDLFRVLKMALVHDLVEIYAGDTFAYDTKGYTDKPQRERAAADRLFAVLPRDQAKEYRSLWEEFDAMETPDARYATAIDRLIPLISNANTDGHTWVMHDIALPQVYERMRPVEKALPELWDYVEDVMREARSKNFIKENNH